MGTNEYSQPASKSSWDSQDFGDVNMVLKWSIFTSPLGHNELTYRSLVVVNINVFDEQWIFTQENESVCYSTKINYYNGIMFIKIHVQWRKYSLLNWFATDVWNWPSPIPHQTRHNHYFKKVTLVSKNIFKHLVSQKSCSLYSRTVTNFQGWYFLWKFVLL